MLPFIKKRKSNNKIASTTTKKTKRLKYNVVNMLAQTIFATISPYISMIDARPTGQPASSLGDIPTTSTTPTINLLSGTILFIGIISGVVLVLLILMIVCCLHKRTRTKRIKRGKKLFSSQR